VLWWQSFGSTVFISKGRDVSDPIRIKDQKVRVFGKIMAQFTKRCGGRPVNLSSAKIHDALKEAPSTWS
jgi:TRAP-type C4-dicarboxylate transport system substrate-binding protein